MTTAAGPVPATEALAGVWAAAGGDPAALDRVHIEGGAERLFSTPFAIGTAAAASIGAVTLAASELWRLRTGDRQPVTVDYRHAAAAFRSERYLRIAGGPPPEAWSRTSGFYRTADGRALQLHTNFPHHLERTLALLGAAEDREAVAAAVAMWDAFELEDALAEAQSCGFAVRTRDEWLAHPHGRAVASLPPFTVERIGDAPAEPLPEGGSRPLEGVRVLDLTRVIAGPVGGRTLAAHGAEVLRIGAESLPTIEALVIDTGFGKRFAHLDLRTEEGRERLRALIREADVLVQSYRPGALAAAGFGPTEVAALRPGIVYVTLSAWGHEGPWSGRRGYDTLVQAATGIAHEHGQATGSDGPKHVPAASIDHATGYFVALGAMAGLARRVTEGGSHLVRVSLAQTGRWIDSLGRVNAIAVTDQAREDVPNLLETMPSTWGGLEYVRPAGGLPDTPPRWDTPPPRPGADEPAWRER